MKTFKYLSFLLLIAFIGTSIYIAVQPNEFSFSSSRLINVPTSLLYNKVNDFKNWHEFSPWIEQEPNTKLTYGEKTIGTGAQYSWNGDVLGEGFMKTLTTQENKFISQQLSIIKPYESVADTEWTFETSEAGTKVTWSMKGKLNFLAKMFTVFKGSVEEKTVPDFERGLFKLDSLVTADMKKYSIIVNGITQHSGGFYLYSSASSKINDWEHNVQKTLSKVENYTTKNNVATAGASFVNYIKRDEEHNGFIFSACVPTTDMVITTESDILTGQLPVFRAVKTTLKGNYTNLKEAWDTAMKYITDNNLEVEENGYMLETYITESNNNPNPADWITEIYIAIK